ncbi:Uncharacterised protein [Mycobacteroides abscessus subsp. abscessus]|nr:Uncharacterised protein [Mycobacteroides abscessus subsp. abscessus]
MFGTYPSSAATCRTRRMVDCDTLDWPRNTRDTDVRDTPAARATSSMVGRREVEG